MWFPGTDQRYFRALDQAPVQARRAPGMAMALARMATTPGFAPDRRDLVITPLINFRRKSLRAGIKRSPTQSMRGTLR